MTMEKDSAQEPKVPHSEQEVRLRATADKSNSITSIRQEGKALPPEFELPHNNPEQ